MRGPAEKQRVLASGSSHEWDFPDLLGMINIIMQLGVVLLCTQPTYKDMRIRHLTLLDASHDRAATSSPASRQDK
jgi:hypothetical protein